MQENALSRGKKLAGTCQSVRERVRTGLRSTTTNSKTNCADIRPMWHYSEETNIRGE